MRVSLVYFSCLFLCACGDISVDNGVSNSGGKAMTAAAATIDTPSTLELSGGYLALKTASTATVGCKVTGSNGASTSSIIEESTVDYQISSTAKYQSQNFTPSTYMKVSAITAALIKTGGPQSLIAELRSTSSGSPATVLGTSAAGSVSALETPDYANVTMALSTSLELTASTTYAVVVRSNTGTYDSNNKAAFMTTPANASACSSFSTYKNSSDSGATWSAGTANAKGVYNVTVAVHATSGQASWIVHGTPNGTWTMSTFTFSENPRAITAGTITYDIGAGTSSSSPTYSDTGLTKAQVQALTGITGEYLYVRANLAVSTPYYDQAELGDGSISAN